MFILQVIKCLELNGAKRVICSKSTRNLEHLSHLLRTEMKLLRAATLSDRASFQTAFFEPLLRTARTFIAARNQTSQSFNFCTFIAARRTFIAARNDLSRILLRRLLTTSMHCGPQLGRFRARICYFWLVISRF